MDTKELRELLEKVRLPVVERYDSKGYARLYESPEEPHFVTGDFLAEVFGDGEGLFAAAVNALPSLLDLIDHLTKERDDAASQASHWNIEWELATKRAEAAEDELATAETLARELAASHRVAEALVEEMREGLIGLCDEVAEGDQLWSEIETAIRKTGRSTKPLKQFVRRARNLIERTKP